jgi:hypothetical protein
MEISRRTSCRTTQDSSPSKLSCQCDVCRLGVVRQMQAKVQQRSERTLGPRLDGLRELASIDEAAVALDDVREGAGKWEREGEEASKARAGVRRRGGDAIREHTETARGAGASSSVSRPR